MKQNEQTLGEAIRSFLAANGLSDRLLETEIYQRWDELAGRDVNVKTKKVTYKDGVLVVYLNSSVLRNELSLHKSVFLERINQRLKGRPLKSVEFK
jgi:hypothetical protein